MRVKRVAEILVLVLLACSVNVLGDNIVASWTAGYGGAAGYNSASTLSGMGFQVSGKASTPLNPGAQLGIPGGPSSLFSESSFLGVIHLALSNVSGLLDGSFASANLDANSNAYAVHATETWNLPIALIFFAAVASIFGLLTRARVLRLAASA